jgi:hypothetical protein
LSITWSDRQSVIQACAFDILDNLPHFLLVLLIIQRFDPARWGFFTKFDKSEIKTKKDPHPKIFEATFGGDNILIFPDDDPVYGGINLIGRSTSAAGARNDTGQAIKTESSDQIRECNDLVVKFSWPNETRASEVTFIEKAREIGETNDLVKDHIPTMLGHIDPPFLTCSTKFIREFLGLGDEGARVLRIIVFRRLEEIKLLDNEDMLIAFLDCFFCESFLRFLHHPESLIPLQVTGPYGTRTSSTETSAPET